MNQKTKDLISQSPLQERPVYSEEDLKILAEYLKESKDKKAWEVYKQFIYGFGYDPLLFETWVLGYAEGDYDYRAIFFQSAMDMLPLAIGEDLDEIDDIVLRWRLERHK